MLLYSELKIQKRIRELDRSLFLNKNYKGELQVMRKTKKPVTYEFNGEIIINLEEHPTYIMSLTEDWTSKTSPVSWSADNVFKRLCDIDSQREDSLVNKIFEHNNKVDEAKNRQIANETEAFVKDWRRDFAKATSDLNVSSLKKIDPRQKGDKKYGNRK